MTDPVPVDASPLSSCQEEWLCREVLLADIWSEFGFVVDCKYLTKIGLNPKLGLRGFMKLSGES